MSWSLTCPHEHLTTVDSMLQVGIGGPVLCLQEKASHFNEGRYRIKLSKTGGSLGRLAYAQNDFDLLVACVLLQGQLEGVLLIPISELVPRMLTLYVMVPSEEKFHQAEICLAARLVPGPSHLAWLRPAA